MVQRVKRWLQLCLSCVWFLLLVAVSRHAVASARGGLAPTRDCKGMLLGFSCAPGTWASDSNNDNNSRNSPYTRHLIKHLGVLLLLLLLCVAVVVLVVVCRCCFCLPL